MTTEVQAEVERPVDLDSPAASPHGIADRLAFWRSPADQPPWARPALLGIAALAGLAYAWGMNGAYLEPYYGGAARSMAMGWHNFFFGAADPWGTISVDKLPGALWFQAISVRVFGPHVWTFVLPQVLEGVLTILVIFRVVRRVAGSGAGLIAAVIMAGSPIVILLDHGNIADTLLLLLLVLAADATTRASLSGRLRSLVWAGVLVGLAFQTKMLQAWLVLPALFLTYLVAAPIPSFLRRVAHLALSSAVVLVVSLSWMTTVTLVPQADRPYVDGSCNDSVFSQVFDYNGLDRLGGSLLHSAGCTAPSTYLRTASAYSVEHGLGTFGIGPSADRLLVGPFGHDDAWLLLPACASAVWLFALRRRRPRTDARRGAVILWSAWLLLTFGFFSAGQFLNSYYVAALLPAVAALCGMGAAEVWHRRNARPVRGALAALVVATVAVSVALVPAYAGVRTWIIASVVLVGITAAGILLSSLRRAHASVWSISVGSSLAIVAMLLGSFWASSLVVVEGLSPFDSPLAPAVVNRFTQLAAAQFPLQQRELAAFVRQVPAARAADVFETSRTTGFYILATGHEFLPIGGFSGRVPAPSLAAFKRLVSEGRVEQVTVVTQPLTREPDLRWAAAHCTRATFGGYYDTDERARLAVFLCARSARAGPATRAGTPVRRQLTPPGGNRGTATPA